MAYNVSPNPLNGRPPAHSFQQKPGSVLPSFGHQAAGSPLGAPLPLMPLPPSVPAPSASAFAPSTLPAQQPIGYPYSNSPQATRPSVASMPTPGQVFIRSNPIVNATAPLAVNTSQSRFPVQHYYYNVSQQEPPSTQKDVKKFLFITGAVVAGMAVTMAATIGALCFFMPGPARLVKEVGSKRFDILVKGFKAYQSEKGSLTAKLASGLKAANSEMSKTPELSMWQNLKFFFKPEAKAKYEKELELAKKAAADNVQSGADGLGGLVGAAVSQLAKTPPEEGERLGKLLKNILAGMGISDPAKFVAGVFNNVDPKAANNILSGVLPADAMQVLNESKSIPELASNTWRKLGKEGQTSFYDFIVKAGADSIKSFSESGGAYSMLSGAMPGFGWFGRSAAKTATK